MADMTLCNGIGCPIAEQCKRYLTKGDPQYQSYFVVAPYNVEKEGCKYFIPVENRRKKNA